MSDRINELIEQLAIEAAPRYLYNQKDFVPGKTPVYYSGPFWDDKEIEMGLKAFLTGKWISAGEYVHRFQSAFSRKFNVSHSHMVNSGSSANLVMMAAAKKKYGWTGGDAVIASPVGFPTTIAPIVQNELMPIFVDIEMRTLNFDLDQLEDKLEQARRRPSQYPNAVINSPVLGNPCDMRRLMEICDENNLILLGDNCDSLGSKWYDEYLTKHYEAWTTSFYPAHHITTGEGGMVSSDHLDLIDAARSFSWWGRACYCVGSANLLPCGTCGKRFSAWLGDDEGIVDHKYIFENMGYNLKPLDLQGAIGLAQLEKFDYIEHMRRENKIRFQALLEKYVGGMYVVEALPHSDPSWFGVPIVCESPELKTRLVAFLEENKIQTRNYFAGNILKHPGYSHLDDYRRYPNANKALTHVFFVGCPPHYNDNVFDYIEEVLKKWTN